jgi:hypothetical protein
MRFHLLPHGLNEPDGTPRREGRRPEIPGRGMADAKGAPRSSPPAWTGPPA